MVTHMNLLAIPCSEPIVVLQEVEHSHWLSPGLFSSSGGAHLVLINEVGTRSSTTSMNRLNTTKAE